MTYSLYACQSRYAAARHKNGSITPMCVMHTLRLTLSIFSGEQSDQDSKWVTRCTRIPIQSNCLAADLSPSFEMQIETHIAKAIGLGACKKRCPAELLFSMHRRTPPLPE